MAEHCKECDAIVYTKPVTVHNLAGEPKQVTIITCINCDRIKCAKCKAPILNGMLKKCHACGHQLGVGG